MMTGCARVEAAARGHRMFTVPSASMEPAIRPGQQVEARPIANGDYRPRRGDIVIVDAFGSWEPSKTTGPHISRVIGIGGDRVTNTGGSSPITVNGTPLDEKTYIYPGDEPNGRDPFDVQVPAGRLWLMGDHRS